MFENFFPCGAVPLAASDRRLAPFEDSVFGDIGGGIDVLLVTLRVRQEAPEWQGW